MTGTNVIFVLLTTTKFIIKFCLKKSKNLYKLNGKKRVKNRARGFFFFFFVKTLQSNNTNGLKKCEICGKYGDIIKGFG